VEQDDLTRLYGEREALIARFAADLRAVDAQIADQLRHNVTVSMSATVVASHTLLAGKVAAVEEALTASHEVLQAQLNALRELFKGRAP